MAGNPGLVKSLDGKIALVTGASRGIGRAVALAIAKAGAHVIITARSVAALEDLDDEIRDGGGSATLLQLDLAQGDRIDVLGPTIYQRWQHLDILVANAGVLGPLSPLPHVTDDAWAEVLAINLSANWRLIRTLDPLLRRAPAARAVFVSSGAARAENAYWGPYAVSKAGLEALVKTYAQELASTEARVNIVNPGPIRTGMRAKAFPGEDPATLPTPAAIAPLFVELVSAAQERSGEIFNFKDWSTRRNGARAT